MHPRGLYISYEDRDHIEEILDNRSNKEVKLIVVSDGEGVLGIGDQGITVNVYGRAEEDDITFARRVALAVGEEVFANGY